MSPEEMAIEVYDDGAFTVFKKRSGLYGSKDKEGKDLVTGLKKESVIAWSREHLNGFQNSTTITTKVNFNDGYKL